MKNRVNVLLKEYEALKNEQIRRFNTLDRMTNYILLIVVAVFSAAVSFPDRMKDEIYFVVMSGLPIFLSPFVFGYINNELMIFRIGRYIQNVLNPVLERIALETMKWEIFNINEAKRIPEMITSCVKNLILILPIIVPVLATIEKKGYNIKIVKVFLVIDLLLIVFTILLIIYKSLYFINVLDYKNQKGAGEKNSKKS